jgi:hypothetical protein
VGSVAPAPAVPVADAAWPAVKAFGVGLGDAVGIAGGGGYAHQWCNGAPGGASGCYSEIPGKRKFTDGASGSVNLVIGKKGSQPDGYVKVNFSATSKLGTGRYLMAGETNETVKYLKNVGAAAQVVSSDWDDTFYVSSGSLKKGTPVTIGVKLILQNPQTDIACDTAKNSFGELDLYSPSVTPPSGSQFNITGYCVNGAFEYYLYQNAKDPGTTATGTIKTAVGDSFVMYFVATGQIIACQSVNYCIGDIVASLSGSYKFKITSITRGATYTTASGNTYK